MTSVEPVDAAERRAAPAIVCYDVDELPSYDAGWYSAARAGATVVDSVLVGPRSAETFEVKAGQFFRIVSVDGPQVGDLNLWNANDLSERFYSGKTRQFHATHVTEGDRLWSSHPTLRPLATITHDSLGWYGFDDDGGGVHDVIGTRCDPYTQRLLHDTNYHHCCHSNLTRAVAAHTGLPVTEAELHVHDVLNVFMCTGFTKDTHQYFMGQPGPSRRHDRVLRRGRSPRCALRLSWRRLQREPLERRRPMPSAARRNPRSARRPGRVDALPNERLRPVSYTHLTLPTICSV